MLALVGPSGAGKSTLVNLIPRFFDVTSGRILIDGHDLRDLTLALVAPPGRPGHAGDDPLQRHGAQQHRLRPARCEADLVEQAARNALAHDFILRMPQGYDTVIGEKGFRLSGGERQRIAIARAILKDAPILILDEATSALDAESESLVQAALANLMQGRTVVVIAHRLSTIRRANRIAVLEDGRITAIGIPRRAAHHFAHLSAPLSIAVHGRARSRRRSDPLAHDPGRFRLCEPALSGEGGGIARMPIYSMTGFARAQVRVHDQLDLHAEPQKRESSLSRSAVAPAFGPRRAGDGTAPRAEGKPGPRPRGAHAFRRSLAASRRPATIANWSPAISMPFKPARDEFGLTGEPDLNAILRMPGALQSDNRGNGDEDLSALAESVLQQIGPLLDELKIMRAREGEALEAILRATLDRLAEATDGVAALRPEVEQRYQERLTQRLTRRHRHRIQPPAAARRSCRACGAQRRRRRAGAHDTHIAHFRELLSGRRRGGQEARLPAAGDESRSQHAAFEDRRRGRQGHPHHRTWDWP